MKIILSQHAKLRIKQQNIDREEVLREVGRLPDFQGKFHWTYRGNTIVLTKSKRGNIIIKTVIAGFKFRKQYVHRRKGRVVSR